MTKKKFLELWNVTEVHAYRTEVIMETEFESNKLLMIFDCYNEDDIYSEDDDFFTELKKQLPALNEIAKRKINELDLNWDNIEVKLSRICFKSTIHNPDGYYHAFALSYYGGIDYDDDAYDDDNNLIDESLPFEVYMQVCFDKNFKFVEAFNEEITID